MNTSNAPDISEHLLKSPYGQHVLRRLPLRRDEQLRAWDAADELLINYYFDNIATTADNEKLQSHNDNPVLLVNDSFGALACALNQFGPDLWSDSVTAKQSCNYNIESNDLNPINFIDSTEKPSGYYRVVFIKLPKNNALLEQQLSTLKGSIDSHTLIIAGGMVKHIQSAQFSLFEQHIGATTASLAKKKARLLLVKPDPELLKIQAPCPYPSYYHEHSLNLTLCNHANVFSRRALDIGSRFMIEQYRQMPRAANILDLGCGNGVLGLMAKQRQQEMFDINPKLHFVDESYMAIASTRANYSQLFSDNDGHFHPSTSLKELDLNDIDLVLCNPPFHQQHTIGDHIAWSMFRDAKAALSKGGVLWVIGNRHMNYHAKLKKIFANCLTVAGNNKFVVLAAVNR